MENSQQIIADLKKNMDAMLELQKQAMDKIPAQHSEIKEKIMNDLSSIPKHIETNDFTSINQLLSRYANYNSK